MSIWLGDTGGAASGIGAGIAACVGVGASAGIGGCASCTACPGGCSWGAGTGAVAATPTPYPAVTSIPCFSALAQVYMETELFLMAVIPPGAGIGSPRTPFGSFSCVLTSTRQ